MSWLSLYQEAVSAQREIYLAFADRIKAFAESGNWSVLAMFLPMGIVFGAVHALTPGHSKTIIATYLVGSGSMVRRGLLVSLTMSATHVTFSVIITLASLPLISVALG